LVGLSCLRANAHNAIATVADSAMVDTTPKGSNQLPTSSRGNATILVAA
jgi:hypothetical protein